jgi:hypothetical protein
MTFPVYGTHAMAQPALPAECWAARFPQTMVAAIEFIQYAYRYLYEPENAQIKAEFSIPVVEKHGDQVMDSFVVRMIWPMEGEDAKRVRRSVEKFIGDLQKPQIRQTYFDIREHGGTILIETPFALLKLMEAFCHNHPRTFDPSSGFQAKLPAFKKSDGTRELPEAFKAHLPDITRAFLGASEEQPEAMELAAQIFGHLPPRAYLSAEDAVASALLANARLYHGMYAINIDRLKNIINADYGAAPANPLIPKQG